MIRKSKACQQEIDWHTISYTQVLSEAFMREFQQEIDWKAISYQALSVDFIREFFDKIDMHDIVMKIELPEDLLEKYLLTLDLKKDLPFLIK